MAPYVGDDGDDGDLGDSSPDHQITRDHPTNLLKYCYREPRGSLTCKSPAPEARHYLAQRVPEARIAR